MTLFLFPSKVAGCVAAQGASGVASGGRIRRHLDLDPSIAAAGLLPSANTAAATTTAGLPSLIAAVTDTARAVELSRLHIQGLADNAAQRAAGASGASGAGGGTVPKRYCDLQLPECRDSRTPDVQGKRVASFKFAAGVGGAGEDGEDAKMVRCAAELVGGAVAVTPGGRFATEGINATAALRVLRIFQCAAASTSSSPSFPSSPSSSSSSSSTCSDCCNGASLSRLKVEACAVSHGGVDAARMRQCLNTASPPTTTTTAAAANTNTTSAASSASTASMSSVESVDCVVCAVVDGIRDGKEDENGTRSFTTTTSEMLRCDGNANNIIGASTCDILESACRAYTHQDQAERGCPYTSSLNQGCTRDRDCNSETCRGNTMGMFCSLRSPTDNMQTCRKNERLAVNLTGPIFSKLNGANMCSPRMGWRCANGECCKPFSAATFTRLARDSTTERGFACREGRGGGTSNTTTTTTTTTTPSTTGDCSPQSLAFIQEEGEGMCGPFFDYKTALFQEEGVGIRRVSIAQDSYCKGANDYHSINND